ncbi:recombinase [Bacillus wiedmannii]|uniref:ERF family protein n=1 Tax=Bacillus wiedmannii TaxID=1890302 RepID=UPI000BF3F912|nr:ERF family protein [Bacillus wiedmannii]PFZ02320.1 recombinase [Bacillus wiedmannii]
MNLWQKLVEIRKDIDVFSKDGKSYGYSYVTGSQVLHKIKQKMDELGVILSPRMGSHKNWVHEYKNGKGKDVKDFVIESEGSYVWINSDKPEEREEVPWKFFGQQDDASKAFGSALTYSERYFLLKFFGVPTDEDDADYRPANKPPKGNGGNQVNNNNANTGGVDVDKLQKAVRAKKFAASKALNKSLDEIDTMLSGSIVGWTSFTKDPSLLEQAKQLLADGGY